MANLGHILAIDVGTGAVRAALFAADGRLLSSVASVPYEPQWVPERPDFSQVDPAAWLDAIETAIGILRAESSLGSVAAVGVSGLFPALIAFDSAGHPLGPAILYSDRRSQTELEAIRLAGIGEAMEQLTGSALTPGTTSVTSLLWLRNHEPATFARATTVGHVNTLIGHWLTGQWGMDRSNASLTGLFDTRAGHWSATLCSALGIDLGLLPPLIEGSRPVGALLAPAANHLGLPEGIPVAMGGGDTLCAALGCGATAPGDFYISSGTTDTLGLCLDRYAYDPRLYCCGHVVPDRYVSIAPMTYTGGCLRWFVSQFCGEADYAALERAASDVPPGSGGLVFLPYLKGERSPVHDPDARGVYFGLTDTTTRDAMGRAVLEGVAYGIRHCLEAMEQAHSVRVAELVVVGKPGRSGLWNQIKANVTGRRVRALGFDERSLLGAAVTGALAAGLLRAETEAGGRLAGLEAFLAPHAAAERVYDPGDETRAIYDRLYGVFTDLYTVARGAGLFERLYDTGTHRP